MVGDEAPADPTTYKLERRTRHKKAGKGLSGFALDPTIRFNKEGHAFLQDHNGNGPMPFNTKDELKQFLADEIDRNFEEHFGPRPEFPNAADAEGSRSRYSYPDPDAGS
jgi:hypothetical protein